MVHCLSHRAQTISYVTATARIVPVSNISAAPCQTVIRECTNIDGGDDNTGSNASFRLVRYWLDECLLSHPHCALTRKSELPTRLINVWSDDGAREPTLEEPVNDDSQQSYLALSHSWGSTPTLRTTLDTIEDRKKGLPWSTLPKTFQDAISITRRLGFRYIWIDSLCIIQGQCVPIHGL